jgi:hypothetical protein
MALLSRTWTGAVVACVALLGLVVPATLDAAETARPEEVQAVFLLNLTRFIRWPESAFAGETAPLVIGVLPNEPVGVLLAEAAHNEVVGKHPIEVREIRSAADLDGCQFVYFAKMEMGQVNPLISPLRAKPVLTVSDVDGFLAIGGQVQIFSRAGHLRMRLDLRNLRRAELSASAPLLRVAEVTGN